MDLNGERQQTGTTSKMIFTVAQIIAHLSQIMSLHPGDVIATGTPPGVGMAKDPRRFLTEGDEMTLEITGLGRQQQHVVRD